MVSEARNLLFSRLQNSHSGPGSKVSEKVHWCRCFRHIKCISECLACRPCDKNMGFSAGMVKIIAHFCQDRWLTVHVGGQSSDPQILWAGCPQGIALSPLLYNIYTADLPVRDDTTNSPTILQSLRTPLKPDPLSQKSIDICDHWHVILTSGILK